MMKIRQDTPIGDLTTEQLLEEVERRNSMDTYKVTVGRTVYESAVVVVQAASEAEAVTKAKQYHDFRDGDWEFNFVSGNREIIDISYASEE